MNIVRYHLAEISQREGDLQSAAADARADLASAARLVESNPTTGRRRDLAASFGRLGSILKDGGNLEEARAALRSSIAISLDLVIRDKENRLARRVFDSSIEQLEDTLEKLGDIPGLHDVGDALLRVRDTVGAGARAEKTLTLSLSQAGRLAHGP